MSSTYDIKPAFQRVIRPLCTVLHGAAVTPNQITAATLVASLGMGLWLAVAANPVIPLIALPVFLLLRMVANALDGMIATTYAKSTPFGAVFNEVGDVIADAALYLPFATLPGISPTLPVVIVILAVTTEVAGLAAQPHDCHRRHDGPMGKSDRALAFGILAAAYAAGLRTPLILNSCLGAIILLLLATIISRCRHCPRKGS